MPTDKPLGDEAVAPALGAKGSGFGALVKSGAIVPVTVISVIALAVLGMLGFIANSALRNGGFMPPPTPLHFYACVGFAQPFQMAFRHGMSAVQLRAGPVTIHGELINGKIAWREPANAGAALGFAPPTQIVYDDTRSIRVIDPGPAAPTERSCARQE